MHELERYQQQHGLKVTLTAPLSLCNESEWVFQFDIERVTARGHSIHGSHVINATGIISKPKLPENFKPGATTIPWMHSIDARAEHLAKCAKAPSRRWRCIGG